MIVIPSIDLRGGQTVRLLYGDYSRETVYEADPVETALSFQAQGAEVIHVVDLDGAKSGVIGNWEILARIFEAVDVTVEVGGGVRSLDSAKALLDQGCGRVVFGTALVRNPDLAERAFHELGERAVAGIDAKDGRAAVAGWIEDTEMDALDLAVKMQSVGCRRVILTDIATDGALSGPNSEMMRRFSSELDIPVIASGGVSTLDDLRSLATTGVEGAIVGRALYEGRFSVKAAVDATR